MEQALTWVLAHWQDLVGTLGVIVMAASLVVKAIAKYTDTKADDRWAERLTAFRKWLDKLALNTPPAEDKNKSGS